MPTDNDIQKAAAMIPMVQQLSDAFGPSGFEEDVLSVAARYLTAGLETRRDSMLNLYSELPQGHRQKPVVMLDAHTDEVGFMVHSVMPNGQITLAPIGGWVPCTVPAHKLVIRNTAGELVPGVVVSKPPHFQTAEEQKSTPDIASMTLDIGAASELDSKTIHGVGAGDPVVPDTRFEQWENGIMCGKAFDCRLGCACAIEVINQVALGTLNVHPVLALASQEEVGARGATVTASTVRPNVAIVFEGTPADDCFAPEWQIGTALKKGPMLRHMDSGMITNPRLMKLALLTAEEEGIPVQHAVRTGGATNGAVIHLSQQGIPALVIGVPVRYVHSHYGLAALQDVVDSVRLAVAILERLDEKVIAEL